MIQNVIDQLGAKKYLEIGVFTGTNFLPIRVAHKTAVDPEFKISPLQKLKWNIKQGWSIRSIYHQMLSEQFFNSVGRGQQFDVVFIDGLHTYSQSLSDVNQALDLLSEQGVIIMHDCFPPSPSAAYPAESLSHAASLKLPGWTGEWCGDTWKTICHLRSSRDDLQIFVLSCDYGLGVIRRGKPESKLDLTPEQITHLSYDDLASNPVKLLNLKDVCYWPQFLAHLKHSEL